MRRGIVILRRLGRHFVSSELIPTKLPLLRRVRAGVAMMADASVVEPQLERERDRGAALLALKMDGEMLKMSKFVGAFGLPSFIHTQMNQER